MTTRPVADEMVDRMVEVAAAYVQEATTRADERFRTGVARTLYRRALELIAIEPRGRYSVRISVGGLRPELWAPEIIRDIVKLTMAGTEFDYRMTDVDAHSTLVTW